MKYVVVIAVLSCSVSLFYKTNNTVVAILTISLIPIFLNVLTGLAIYFLNIPLDRQQNTLFKNNKNPNCSGIIFHIASSEHAHI